MTSAASVGIRNVLDKLNDKQLFGLARTITQGLLNKTFVTREDALEVIFKHSTNEVSILRRRVITRDILFTYLHENNVTIILPTTKDKLIDQICTLWNIQNQEISSESLVEVKKEEVEDEYKDEQDVNTMAKQFSQWFYEMMNKDEPLEASHFFPDAVLSLTISSEGVIFIEDVSSPDEIVDILFKTKIQYRLLFNPNLSSEGLRGVIDPHGLVVILVCGTLHSSELCVGVFEQMFSLARDPFCENHWKIKMTKVNLKRKQVLEEPTLKEGNFSSALVPVKYGLD